MWPFGRKQKPEAPPDMTVEGIAASFHPDLGYWAFELEGIDFTVALRPLDAEVLAWARQALGTIRLLDAEIHQAVSKEIAGWELSADGKQLLNVCLDEYPDDESLEISFCGDGTWGDYGVSIYISAGRVIASRGGD